LKSGDRSSHRRHFNSNSKVLTTRIFLAGVLVGLYGAD